MSRVCPQCSQVSPEANPFCTRCGYRFQGNEQVATEDATLRSPQPASMTNMPANADPAATFTPGGQQVQTAQPPASYAPTIASAPPVVSVPPSYSPDSNPLPVQGGYMSHPLPQPMSYPQPTYGQQPYGAPQPQVMSSSSGVASLQRAFAGKGTAIHHQSWLLDGKQVQPATLLTSLIDNIHKQGVMGVRATSEHLREQGVAMEERDFVRVQYGTSSVYVYMAPMGPNIYISRTSTVQQPISRVRLVSLIGLLVLMFISFLCYSLIYPSSYADTGTVLLFARINAFFSLTANGLLIFFLFVLLRSVMSWLAENDFLLFLRPNRLNDFTLDTLFSIEHVTDKGIRETLQQAGLDAEEIGKASHSYVPQQPLRRF